MKPKSAKKAMKPKSAKKKYGAAPTRFRRYDLLPDDALRLIFSKTSFVDQIQLKLVCKSWKKLLDEGDIRSANILPWKMFYSWQRVADDQGLVEGLCKLYDPSHRKTYTLEDGITKRGPEATHKFVGAEILESKYGFVLFQKRTSFGSLFLYCPFTSEVIDLPKLERHATLATFSSNPTSADCLFFALRMGGSAAMDSISISLCRRGDHAWKTIQVLDSITGSYLLRGVAYSNGAFFCLFEYGQLGAFNVATERWDLLFSEKWQSCYYPFESDGRLFSVQYTHGFRISRFDFSSRNWVQGASRKDLAAFPQHDSYSSMLIPAVGEATQLGGTLNTIFPTTGVKHYSFRTYDYLPLLNAYSKTKLSSGMSSVWIQPPKYASFLLAQSLLMFS
ncbi:hypothetical protein Tsubulata_041260 [Turnera subulata]|uniref:F-box domain-containing protein n=1 Tax=Turnera subulata TaxID=218843 RepID=A0A9Q0IYF3_9ROSI|nr:hypothetical protein Tsubulata_041260 [Turnera subulata]